MKDFFAFVLCLATRGGIDYSPEARRKWTVDFGNPTRYPGRGATLVTALRHYIKRETQ